MPSLVRATSVLAIGLLSAALPQAIDKPISFSSVAAEAGLTVVNRAGTPTKDYIIDSIGNGVAFLDYDNDGDLDVLIVNGSTLDRLEKGGDQMVALYRNNGRGTFTDVTTMSGFTRRGWGTGVCVADYDNDGFVD